MAQVLELKDGELITPRSLFDVMEVIEEHMGCDVRQYLEEYLEGTEEPEPADDDIKEHYRQVFENIVTEMEMMLVEIGEKKRVEDAAVRVIRMAKREM